ncbi:Oxidoreductase [Acidisarcina polymorpha]|uniref:Oxidoreductase n=1 Tax=Acidisarcina polymorpha TaxID=2211140 RepID=A0A2Z5FYM0_9BACT|nr:NmrA family NAD(P)-binding protein [Acidisarcina polymorpha]AXC11961.1 Oxidoreductase [Acidisarcina polymorpha]
MQTNKTLRVLAVAAAGPSASLVIPELLKRNVSVRAFVHKPEDEPTVQKLGLTDIVVGELSDAPAVAKALEGIDAVFYIAPAALENEAEVGKQFVAAAKQAGVRRVVFSSVIHPVLSELVNHADKAPVEEALLDSGMEYVFLHPAMFFQNIGPAWAKVKETGVYGEPWSTETRFSRVDYRDVAEVAAIALTEERLLHGTFELCAEDNLNRHDLAALMSQVVGKQIKPIKVEIPAQANMPPKLTRMFAWYDKHALLGNSTTLRAILGREPRTLRAFFEELNSN